MSKKRLAGKKVARKVSEEQWLRLLLDPKTRIRIDLHSLCSRLTVAPDWDTGVQCLSEHLFYFIAAGQCLAHLDGKSMVVPPGSLVWISPGERFRFTQERGGTPVVLHRFRLAVGQGHEAFRLTWPRQWMVGLWPALEWIKQIAYEANQTDRYNAYRIRNLVSLLSLEVFAHNWQSRGGDPVLTPAQRREITSLVEEDPGRRLSPAQLARHLDFSPDYFSRLFQRTYGLPPRSWLVQQRLRRAAVLLNESNATISGIAGQLGYPDVYLFSRQFHQQFGMSPRLWRQQRARSGVPAPLE